MEANYIHAVLADRDVQREAISTVRALKNIIAVLEEYAYDETDTRPTEAQAAIDDAKLMLHCAQRGARG